MIPLPIEQVLPNSQMSVLVRAEKGVRWTSHYVWVSDESKLATYVLSLVKSGVSVTISPANILESLCIRVSEVPEAFGFLRFPLNCYNKEGESDDAKRNPS